MNEKCLEIGIVQAFLDGETTADVSARITDHVAGCDACALMLADADEQNAVVFGALDRELNSLVPTQRLWSRINDSITVERQHVSIWGRLSSAFALALSSPSIAVGAVAILFVGTFAIVFGVKFSEPGLVPTASDTAAVAPKTDPSAASVAQTEVLQTSAGTESKRPATPIVVKESKLSPEKVRSLVTNARFDAAPDIPRAQNAVSTAGAYLPGEESYVKTISDLDQAVNAQKDRVLSPSNRVSYERDMAVLNDSIRRMQTVVRKNPKNQAAKQILYSAYQDKIDLLNSVAQRDELMASLK